MIFAHSGTWPTVLARPAAALSEAPASVLVDTGAGLSWFPGDLLESPGIAVLLYAVGTWTTDEVVFGEPRDLVLLGARSLEGLNLRVDPVAKKLIDAGPAPAAVAA